MEKKDASSLFDSLLADPLHLCIDGGRGTDRVIAVLDGLDETMIDGRSELAELLAGQATKLPPWFGLVVTSRPEPAILRQFEALHPYRIDAETWQNQADLRLFARTWLKAQTVPEHDLDQMVEHVLDAANGSFLYVRLLKEGTERHIFDLANLGRLPPGHAAIFERWLRRQFPARAAYERAALPLLSLVRSCGLPLRLSWAERALGLHLGELHRALETLGALFPLENGAIRACHKSLLDWLCDPSSSGPWFVPEADDSSSRKLLSAMFLDMAASSGSGRFNPFDDTVLKECDALARRMGYEPPISGMKNSETRLSNLDLPGLEDIWRNVYSLRPPHLREVTLNFIRFVLMVSGQRLVSNQTVLFGEMAARAVDLRGDDGAFDIAMNYALWALRSLQDSGHHRGHPVELILRAGARVLDDSGRYEEESKKWTAAADAADSSSVVGP
jgi:hypothetical protein